MMRSIVPVLMTAFALTSPVDTPAITIITTASNSPPAQAGQPIQIAGSARYDSPSLAVEGGRVTIVLASAIVTTHTDTVGTYVTNMAPMATGTYTAQVCVTDFSLTGCTSVVFTVSAPPALQITTISLPAGTYATPYSATLEAIGGSPPYSWSVLPVLSAGAWGSNQYGQVSGATGRSNLLAIAGGTEHCLGLQADGTVIAWGANVSGRCTVPAGLTGVTAIAAGQYHSVALRADGTVAVWGDNGEGQLNVPAGLTGVVAIAAGGRHTLAIKSDGTVAAWGGSTLGQSTVPSGLTGVVGVAGGQFHSLARLANGTITNWGYDGYGAYPMPSGLTNIVAIAGGGYHSLALNSAGLVTRWGTPYLSPATSMPAGLTGVVAIAGGINHSLVLKSDGSVVAWGNNNKGQCDVPAGLTDVVAIAGSGDCSLVLRRNPALPEGLVCSTNGLLSGTPDATGTRSVVIMVRDSTGATANKRLDITIEDGTPSAPVSEAASDVTATSFTANWQTSPDATNYFLDVATDPGFVPMLSGYDPRIAGNVLTLPVTGLSPGQTYFYRVRAQSSGGISGSSGTITVTTAKAAQTIAFPAINDQRVTNVVGLAASASSGLPVTFTVGAGMATLSDGTNLSFSGEGTVSIVASQLGDASWHPAPNVTNTFHVTTMTTATVTLENLDHLFNGTPRSVTATTAPPGLVVEITYDGSLAAPTAPGSYAVTGTINDAFYEGSATGTLTIHDLLPPVNLIAMPAPGYPATRASVAWQQTQGLRALITVAPSWPVGEPIPGTIYAANDTFGNQSVVQGSTPDQVVEAAGLLPGQPYYFTFYAENGAHYSVGANTTATMGYPQVRNTGGGSPEAPADIYLGDTGVVFGCEVWSLLETNQGRARVWISRQPDLPATGEAGPWTDFDPAEHKTTVSAGVFNETGLWRWGLQIDYGSPYGDVFWYNSDSAGWSDAVSNPSPTTLVVDVKPIDVPTTISAISSPTAPHSEIQLSWALNARTNDVLVVRRPASATAIDPTPGMPLNVGATLGPGTVIYRGPGTSHTDSGLSTDTGYDYTFYSVNHDYYSLGVEIHANTLACAPEPPTGLIADPGRDTFTAHWDPVPEATVYHLEVSPSPDFTLPPVISTVFRETMGNVAGITTVEDHEAAGGFDNTNFTMRGNQAADPTDLRSDSPSSDYLDPEGNPASGGANVWFDATGTRGFLIADIDAHGHDALQLSFGYRKEAGPNVLTIQWSANNGADWAFIMDPPYYTGMPPESAPPGWYMVTNLALSGGACQNNLQIRWVKSWTNAMRIDDVLLQGVDYPNPYVPGYQDLTTSDTQVTVTGLQENTTYYFRIRAEGLPGCISTHSATASVSTVALETTITYVSPAGSHTPPFSSWATAATNIQDAVDVSPLGGLVLVGDGVYDTGNRIADGGPPNRVVIDKNVRVESLNGPAATIIRGALSGPGTNAVRAVYLGAGASIVGFTIEQGSIDTEGMGPPSVQTAGAGIYAASPLHSVSNCVIRQNRSFLGAGVAFANLIDCLVESNAATYGGGAYGGTLDHCMIVNNTAGMEGGGVLSPSSISRSRISGNIAGWAGGGLVSADNVLGCIISGNWSRRAGGTYNSTLRRCTVSGNIAQNFAGGMQGGSAVDSIVYHNKTTVAANYVATGLENCYTDPAPTGNFSADPMLVSPINGHLLPGSPCLDASGASGLEADLDGDANPQGASEDIGADEFNAAAPASELTISLSASTSQVIAGNPVTFSFEVTGLPTGLSLDLGDGQIAANQSILTHTYSATGSYTVIATATNDLFSASGSVTVNVYAADTIFYVAPGGGHVSPFASWANASTTIQAAVDIAPQGATVLVSNGVYVSGGRLYPGTALSNVVIATNAIRIRSVNGPDVTIIGPSNQVTGRGVFLGAGSTLEGFTVHNFKSRPPGSDLDLEMAGGGIYCSGPEIYVRNCNIIGNRAETWGGGVNGGIIEDSMIISNTAGYIVTGGGGGANGSTLHRCRVAYNEATWGTTGGGLSGGAAYDSIIEYNKSTGNAAGAANSTVERCIVRYNQGRGTHGASSLVCNSLVHHNTGAGCSYGYIINSTVVGNQGGGVWQANVTNSIIHGNTPSNYYALIRIQNSCTTPLPESNFATNNMDADPMFYNAAADDYRLATNSPCINAGTNYPGIPDTADLDGNPRIQQGTVDIGAYEYPSYDSNGVLRAWLRNQGLPDDGSADSIDFDGDSFSTRDEWVAGTDALSGQSALAFGLNGTAPEVTEQGVVLRWPSVEGRTYRITCASNLVAGFTQVVASGIKADPPVNSYPLPPMTSPASIYRIEVE